MALICVTLSIPIPINGDVKSRAIVTRRAKLPIFQPGEHKRPAARRCSIEQSTTTDTRAPRRQQRHKSDTHIHWYKHNQPHTRLALVRTHMHTYKYNSTCRNEIKCWLSAFLCLLLPLLWLVVGCSAVSIRKTSDVWRRGHP